MLVFLISFEDKSCGQYLNTLWLSQTCPDDSTCGLDPNANLIVDVYNTSYKPTLCLLESGQLPCYGTIKYLKFPFKSIVGFVNFTNNVTYSSNSQYCDNSAAISIIVGCAFGSVVLLSIPIILCLCGCCACHKNVNQPEVTQGLVTTSTELILHPSTIDTQQKK